MTKKRIYLLGTFLLATILLILYYINNIEHNGNTPKEEQIRIAAILNMTGPSARFDAVKMNTLNLASERIKILFPDIPLVVNYFDAGGSPEVTIVAVRKALDWGASYFLSGTSPTALAIADQVHGYSRPIVQMANAANPNFGPPNPLEYRLWPDWEQEADIISGIIKQENIGSILLIHSADPYSEALTKELRSKTDLMHININDLAYDPASTPDFRPAIIRAKQENMEAIVIFGLPPGIRSLMSQMAQVGWNKSLIGGVNINLAVSDYDSAGLTGPLWLIETEAMRDNLRKDSEAYIFRSKYLKEYGETPPFHALYIADALYFIASAWNETKNGNIAIGEQIKHINSFEGASGHVDITNDGILQYQMAARKAR